MKVKHFSTMILGSIFTLFFGCREYLLYEFTVETVAYGDVKLSVSLEGEYGPEYEIKGRKYADWGFPYMLDFFFETKEEIIDFDEIQVVDLKLIGQESKKQHKLPDSKTREIYDWSKASKAIKASKPNQKGFTTIISIGGINSKDYKYEDYLVKGRFLFKKNGVLVGEEELSVVLKTDFKKSRRSDWVDEQMSV